MKKLLMITVTALFALSLFGCAEKKAPAVKSDALYVKAVENLSDDFILGADVSSLPALEASGVKFYDFEGTEADLLKTLSENGVNYIRVRIWVDPFDKDGHGYGGGNCTVDTAVELGVRAKKYGMKLLADFHYSDFWADPSKQQAPKAWAGMSIEEKTEAVEAYTRESIQKLKAADLTLGMVQIGNETTTGFCGEKTMPKVTRLMGAASRVIRELAPETLIAVHLTNPESVNYDGWALQLSANEVDYDVFATSYYPYWHGTLENLKQKLEGIAKDYGKKVMVAETQWAYTADDTDGQGNTIGDAITYDKNYIFSPQGQANEIRDVVNTVASIDGGIGVFYWEPAWIAVPGETYEESLALWEKYGSGWAASYATEYDPDDAGKYYGGSACDNQALFDAEGKPLESLKVFALVRTGNELPLTVDGAEDATVEVKLNNDIVLPETVGTVMSDNSVKATPVIWDVTEERLKEISASPVGVYTVKGVTDTDDKVPVTCYIKMVEENYIENYSFEKEDRSMWVITDTAPGKQTDFQNKALDAYSGDYSLHFWNADKVGFTVEQTVTGLRAGTYLFSIQAQGGDFDDTADLHIYVEADGKTYTESFKLSGWQVFQNPVIHGIECTSGTIKVGVSVDANGGAWGTLDEFLLNPEK